MVYIAASPEVVVNYASFVCWIDVVVDRDTVVFPECSVAAA